MPGRKRDPQVTPQQWRARAKQTRELALGMVEDATQARMEQRAQEYEHTAEMLERAASMSTAEMEG